MMNIKMVTDNNQIYQKLKIKTKLGMKDFQVHLQKVHQEVFQVQEIQKFCLIFHKLISKKSNQLKSKRRIKRLVVQII